MTTSGLENGNLVLHRSFAASANDVWASITVSERLARWYGTWTGDPDAGFVMVTMNAEADEVAAGRYDITECDPPHFLSIELNDENFHWRLRIELTETNGLTTLTFIQTDIDPNTAGDIAAGWRWYLDRLGASIDGTTPPTLDDFESTYLDT